MLQFRQHKTRLRRTLGRGLQQLGFSLGLMSWTARLRQFEGAIILMYHSVADETQSKWIDPSNHVPAEIFDQQMMFLSRQRKVISLTELVETIQQGKTLAAGTAVITFDDGYLDNFTVAAPILEHYELPATLFLPVGYIDRGETQWVDQAFTIFKFRTKRKLAWGQDAVPLFNLDNPSQKKAAYLAVCRDLLLARSEKRMQLLIELTEQLQPTTTCPRLTMTWDEVRALLAWYRCFDIGGHTMEHTDLTSIYPDKARKEVFVCARRISEELGVRPRHFSFCYGRTSEFLRNLVAEAGFDSACGDEGLDPVVNAPTDLYRLPRVTAQSSMQRFELLTSSANTGIWRRLAPN